MPTSITPIADSAISVRFKEPYVSDALNRKFLAMAGATGVVRGGRLVTAGVGLTVQVQVDPDTGDSVFSYINAAGQQFTVRLTGNVNLDLTPEAGNTVYIALYLSYSIGAVTTAEWRAYTEAELFGGAPVAENADVVVLGRVVVPGVGPIPAANVSPLRRRNAWEGAGRGQTRWEQVVRNPGFEVGPAGTTMVPLVSQVPHWTMWPGSTPNGVTVSVDDAGLAKTGDRYLVIDATAAGGVSGIDLFHDGWLPVTPGQHIRASISVRGNAWGGLTHVGALRVDFYDEDWSFISDMSASFASLSGTFDWTEVNQVGAVPTGARYARIAIGLFSNPGVPSGTLYIDDVHVYVEPIASASHDDGFVKTIGHEIANKLSIMEDDPEAAVATGLGSFVTRMLQMTHARALNALVIQRGLTTPIAWTMRLMKGAIQGIGLDMAQALLADDRVGTVAPATYAKLWELPAPNSNTVRMFWGGGNGGLYMTINADYDNATQEWVSDGNAGGQNTAFGFQWNGADGFRMRRKRNVVAAGTRWTDVGWDENIIDMDSVGTPGVSPVSGWFNTDGYVRFLAPTATGSNPPSTTAPESNALYAKSVPKSWGFIDTDGAGSAVSLDGYNVIPSISGTSVRLDFPRAFANVNYSVVATPEVLGGPAGYIHLKTDKISSSACLIIATDIATNTPIDLAANIARFSFVAFGAQS